MYRARYVKLHLLDREGEREREREGEREREREGERDSTHLSVTRRKRKKSSNTKSDLINKYTHKNVQGMFLDLEISRNETCFPLTPFV